MLPPHDDWRNDWLSGLLSVDRAVHVAYGILRFTCLCGRPQAQPVFACGICIALNNAAASDCSSHHLSHHPCV